MPLTETQRQYLEQLAAQSSDVPPTASMDEPVGIRLSDIPDEPGTEAPVEGIRLSDIPEEESAFERLGNMAPAGLVSPIPVKLNQYPRLAANAASAALAGIVKPDDLLPFSKNSLYNREMARAASKYGQEFTPSGVDYAPIEGIPAHIANAVGMGAGYVAGLPGRVYQAAELGVKAIPALAKTALGRATGRAATGAVGGIAADISEPETYARNASLGALLNAAIPPIFQRRVKPKPFERIIHTPEEQVATLSQKDQKIWYEQASLRNKATGMAQQQQLDTLHQVESGRLKSQWKALSTKLDEASFAEELRIRKLLAEALPQKNEQYRALVDPKLETHGNLPLDANKMLRKLEKRWSHDPETLNAISSHLGIANLPGQSTEEALYTIVKGAGKYPQTPARLMNLRDVYSSAKQASSEISATARAGNRTYTKEELMSDRSYDFLMDYLKEEGVDLGEANRMWSTWAKVRTEAVNRIKPFAAESKKSTFYGTLKRVAQGVDPHGALFLKNLEAETGIKVGGSLKDIVRQMNANQRVQLAIQIEAETTKNAAKLAAIKEQMSGTGLTATQVNSLDIAAKREAKQALAKRIATWAGAGVAGAYLYGATRKLVGQ